MYAASGCHSTLYPKKGKSEAEIENRLAIETTGKCMHSRLLYRGKEDCLEVEGKEAEKSKERGGGG